MNETRGLWRGKRADYNDWIEGDLQCESEKGKPYYLITDRVSHWAWLADSATLGECTGLRDKNGKLIFEGDICTVATPNIADDEYGVVKFDEKEAVFVIDFGTYTINFCDNINSSAAEVIGNIHDNPEYL